MQRARLGVTGMLFGVSLKADLTLPPMANGRLSSVDRNQSRECLLLFEDAEPGRIGALDAKALKVRQLHRPGFGQILE